MTLKIAFFDINRAHFCGTPYREVFGELLKKVKWKHGPDFFAKPEEELVVIARCEPNLPKRPYGVGGTAWLSLWSNGAIFRNADVDFRALCHGADFVLLGDKRAIEEFGLVLGKLQHAGCLGLRTQRRQNM